MQFQEPVRIVVATHLSRKPAKRSFAAAAVGMGVLVAASFAFWNNWHNLAFQLPAIPERVFVNHEYWRLFTALLIHSNADHLISNGLLFCILSYLLYGYFGWVAFPFLSVLFGALTNFISLLTYPPGTELLGASGMIYWMAAFWLALYVVLDTQQAWRGRLLRSAGFVLCLLVPTRFEANVSYRTHGIGFALGLLAGGLYYLANRKRLKRSEVAEFEPPEPVGPHAHWN